MKYKLPILTAGFASCLLAVCWWCGPLDRQLLSLLAVSQEAVVPGQQEALEDHSVAAPGDSVPHGQWLVGRAVRELVGQESIQAEIRQQVDLYGHHLVGVGRYRQFFVAGEQRLRLEVLTYQII